VETNPQRLDQHQDLTEGLSEEEEEEEGEGYIMMSYIIDNDDVIFFSATRGPLVVLWDVPTCSAPV